MIERGLEISSQHAESMPLGAQTARIHFLTLRARCGVAMAEADDVTFTRGISCWIARLESG